MADRQPGELAKLFCARLKQTDPGERARLKRNAGKTLADADAGALGLFYGMLPRGVPEAQEGMYFMTATLFGLADAGGGGDLGAALRAAQNRSNNKGLDRRVEALLDADDTQLAFRLRQAVHYLQSQRVKVDWECLLDDLLHWGHPRRYVQQRWARSYFGKGGDDIAAAASADIQQ